MKTKKYRNGDSAQSYQGDVSIIRIEKVDVDVEFSPLEEKLVVGHSESGHNHVLVKEREAEVEIAKDEQGYFIRVKKGKAQIVHEKTGGHEPQTIEQGVYFIGHQMEYNEFEDRKVVD